MSLVHGHGFVTLGTPDLDHSVEFYRQVCRLEVRERREGEVFLTGNQRHHWLRLVQAEQPGLIRLGYQATDRASLDEIVRRLDAAGIAWSKGGNLADDGVQGGIRFRDPFGIEIEVYEEMLETSHSPVPADVGFTELLHAVVFVSDVDQARDFYRDTLGMRRSDQIQQLVVFLRGGNRYHHSLGLARGESGRLDHFAILVDDLDVVMRLRLHAIRLGVLGDDVVRHTASGSISVYLRDDALGSGIEFCTGHQVVDDDDFDGRLLVASPSTVNAWNVPYSGVDGTFGTAAATSATGGTAAANLASSSAQRPPE